METRQGGPPIVRTSRIFDWYKPDFGDSQLAVFNFVANVLDTARDAGGVAAKPDAQAAGRLAALLRRVSEEPGCKWVLTEYDWSTNSAVVLSR